MHLQTLGGLRLVGAAFRKPKPLLLLAYLVLEGPTERRHLAELFWPRAANRHNSLAKALSQLRTLEPPVFAEEDGKLRATLAFDAGELVDALGRGDDHRAVDLYRAPLLDGVHLSSWGSELEEWVVARRERLALRVRSARLRLAATAAAAARPEGARRHAEAAYSVAAAPVPEPHELRRLYRLLLPSGSALLRRLRHDAAEFEIDLDDDDAAPPAASGGAAADGDAPPPAEPLPPLPDRGSSFVGRELEIAEVGEMLRRADCRLISIVGPGGAGKTRLALEVAGAQLRRRAYADGVRFVPLEAVVDAGAVASVIARRCGIGLHGATDPRQQLRQHLRSRQLLLVLDNCEHLPGVAEVVGDLLAGCPRLEVMVTSRERLRLQEEWRFALAGLAFPHPGTPYDQARAFDAVRLFAARARRERRAFDPSGDEGAAVVEICARVEGSPLAIELAASWVGALPIREIADAIHGNAAELETRSRNASPRHRSIRAVFEHSWALVSERQRANLSALAVFRGGFTVAAAERVAEVPREALAALVDASLVRGPSGGRYDLHPLVHTYAAEKLELRPDAQRAVTERHAEHYLGTVRNWHGSTTPPSPAKIAALAPDIDNILAAWRRLVIAGCDGVGNAAEALTWYFEVRAEYHEGVAELDAAIAALAAVTSAEDGVDRACAEARGALLVAKAWLGHWLENEAAERWADDGLALLRPLGAVSGIVLGLRVKGIVAWRRGRYADAERIYREAVTLAAATGARALEATVLDGLGLALSSQGRYPDARRCHDAALAINRNLGSAFQTVHNLVNLAALSRRSGADEDPRPLARQALELAREVDFRQYLPYCLLELARAQAHAADRERGEATARDALAAATRIGDTWTEAGSLLLLGRLGIDAGDHGGAAQALERSVAVAWGNRDRLMVLRCLFEAAAIALARGDTASAAGWLASLVSDPAVPHWTARDARALLARTGAAVDLSPPHPRRRSGGAALRNALAEAFPGVVMAAVPANRTPFPPLTPSEPI